MSERFKPGDKAYLAVEVVKEYEEGQIGLDIPNIGRCWIGRGEIELKEAGGKIDWKTGNPPREGWYPVTVEIGCTRIVTVKRWRKLLDEWGWADATYNKILAWCELPEPYEGGEE